MTSKEDSTNAPNTSEDVDSNTSLEKTSGGQSALWLERFALGLPVLSLAVIHAVIWRTSASTAAILYGLVLIVPTVVAGVYLRREELLTDMVKPRFGDMTLGLFGAIGSLVALFGLGTLLTKGTPAWFARELLLQLRQATTTPAWLRLVLVIVTALSLELQWRGGVFSALSFRMGTRPAAFVSWLMFVVASIPSMQFAVIVSTALIGAAASFVTLRDGRIAPAFITHGVALYLAIERILPELWKRITAGG